MKVLFLTPYPHNTAGSQRFRFEQYYSLLKEKGIDIDVQSFFDEQTWEILYIPGNIGMKLWGLVKGFARRSVRIFFLSIQYDVIFIHREATPIGPPIFEWLIAKVLQKKILYDFDDAIWKENTSAENSLAARLKWHSKTESICRWSWRISVGNDFLAHYAKQFNHEVVVNPTTIDSENLHLPERYYNKNVVIGWTGTHSTLKYLQVVEASLNELNKKHNFELVIIADKAPDIDLPNLRFIQWMIDSEIADLNRIDIGLMPLTNDEWAKGKCGFKALQFMALEIPVLVSPVGINAEIVDHDIHGYHCESSQDWVFYLEKLISDSELRLKMGKEGRKKVAGQYSVRSNAENFLQLFNK